MFVLNCTVEKTEVLHYKPPQKKVFKRHKRKATASESSDGENAEASSYHPVKCQSCGTEVAVYDKDEVYHFFNVLVGYA